MCQSKLTFGKRRDLYCFSGVTLVEILVVISILSILFAMLLVGIQQAREAARASSCRNNLRQITIAAKAFESVKGHLPAGTLGYANSVDWDEFRNGSEGISWRKVPQSSFWVQLLPYLEQGPLSAKLHPAFLRPGESLVNAMNRDGSQVEWFGMADGFSDAASSTFPTLFCPSDSLSGGIGDTRVFGGVQPVNLSEMDDRFDFVADLHERFPFEFVSSNYLGCSGASSGGIHVDPVRHAFRGAQSSGERITSSLIVDGTSNTILFAETLGFRKDYQIEQVSTWVVTGVGRMRSMAPWMSDLGGIIDPTGLMLGNSRNSAGIGFGSAHPNVVYVAQVDGSVDSLSRDSNWLLLYSRAGIADGKLKLPANEWSTGGGG